MIVSELEKNNITIQITEPDEYTNGYYIIGSKTIYIPQNQIPTNLNKESTKMLWSVSALGLFFCTL